MQTRNAKLAGVGCPPIIPTIVPLMRDHESTEDTEAVDVDPIRADDDVLSSGDDGPDLRRADFCASSNCSFVC